MAQFTIELGKLVEDGFDIGLNKYPIFAESYRDLLNENILKHYYFHEIGFETAEMFAQQVDAKMSLIMPRMNKLYESELLKIDPLSTISIKQSSTNESEHKAESNRKQLSTQDNKGTAQSDSTTTSKSISVNNQFPQNAIGVDGSDYATAAAESTGDTTVGTVAKDTASSTVDAAASDSTTGSGASLGESVTTGYSGAAADLLMRYRASIINVDELVIEELSDMFMSVVQIPDSFTPNPYRIGYGGFYNFSTLGNLF